MTDSELLDAAEAYEDERNLWSVRTNKMNPQDLRYEVVRINQVHIQCPDIEIAHYEMEQSRMLEGMKKAFKAVGH